MLTTTGSVGAAGIVPSLAAAGPDDDEDDDDDDDREANQPSEEEVRQSLTEMEAVARNDSDIATRSTGQPADANLYIGEYKNAQTPLGKPFAIESYEEYLDRDAPPGFPPSQFDGDVATTDGVSTQGLPSFYLKENIGSVSLAGYTFNVGVGVGVQIRNDGAGVGADLSFDLYIGGVSFAVLQYSVGYGVYGDKVCVENIAANYLSVDLKIDLCPTISFSGDELSIGGSLTVCADPCEIFTCSFCEGLSISLSEEVDI